MAKPYYVNPRYVSDGDDVWVPYGKTGQGLRCCVIAAHGDHARIVNDAYGVDRMVRLDDVYVPPGDPRA